jgi:hypothetical protein
MGLDINGIITIIAVLAYVIVFMIQNAQMKKQNEVVKTMESFMNIFSVEEVIKYNNMREETVKGNLKNYIKKDENARKLIEEVSKNTIEPVKAYYMSIMGERFSELFLFATGIIGVMPEKEKIELFLK